MIKMHEKYLEALKTFTDYVTVKEWAVKYDEMYPKQTKDEYSEKIKKIGRSISSLVSTGKWANMLLIDKNTKPQKIKYTTDKNQKDDIVNNIYLSKSPKIVKTINFEILMKAIKDLPDDYDFPQRDKYIYFENDKEYVGHKEYIAFEMAIRNKDLIDILKKLDYIDKIIQKCQMLDDFKDWLRGIEYWESKFEGESPELSVTSKQKKECFFIAEFAIKKFKEEIEFLNIENEPKNEKSKAIISLKIIADYLQNKLVEEYHIYKEGYYFIKDSGKFDPDDVIDSDSIYKHNFNTHDFDDQKKLVIDGLLNRKKENMIESADMFFMYDYFKRREEENNSVLCALDIKCELTKYHGIKIKGFKERFTYDECLEKYEEFKNLEASFYYTEKTINEKIAQMIDFIDNKQYRFILFY